MHAQNAAPGDRCSSDHLPSLDEVSHSIQILEILRLRNKVGRAEPYYAVEDAFIIAGHRVFTPGGKEHHSIHSLYNLRKDTSFLSKVVLTIVLQYIKKENRKQYQQQ